LEKVQDTGQVQSQQIIPVLVCYWKSLFRNSTVETTVKSSVVSVFRWVYMGQNTLKSPKFYWPKAIFGAIMALMKCYVASWVNKIPSENLRVWSSILRGGSRFPAGTLG